MRADLNADNCLPLPESLLKAVGGARRFDIVEDNGRLVLIPLNGARTGEDMSPADQVRAELEERGITEADLEEAVRWARRGR